MVSRILDPDRFMLAGAVIDWTIAARRHGANVADLVAQRKIGPAVVQLRWILDPGLGLPTQAFQVLQRVHADAGTALAPPHNLQSISGFSGRRFYSWDVPLVFVHGTVTSNAGATNMLVVAYSGPPDSLVVVGYVTLGAGSQIFSFSGNKITCIAVMNGTASNIEGFDGTNAANDPAWKPVELVGLPVDGNDWSSVLGWGDKQGLVGTLKSPVEAALDRYSRGAPFFGWDDLIEAGHPAPPWRDADPKAIVETMRRGMLDDLRTMMTTRPPADHIGFTVEHALSMQGGGEDAAANFAPIQALMLGISSDPLLSLIAGFGTAYDFVRRQDIVFAAANPAKISPFDFMVTATFEKGRSGNGEREEYAAILCTPRQPVPVLTPTNLSADLEGLVTPDVPDERYRALIAVSWDLPPQTTPFRIASYAAARYGLNPVSGTVPLMDPRQDDPNLALQPISATASRAHILATGQLTATDDSHTVDPAAAPNQLRYGIAHQDLFGQWSGWAAANASASEPLAQRVGLVAARLDTVVPASGSVCPASLVLDFSWDWTVRSPKQISLVGRLYAAAKAGDAPADLSLPPHLATGFPGSGGVPFTVSFNGGDAAVLPPGPIDPADLSTTPSLAYMTEDATALQPAPVTTTGPRRYRLTIPGIKLDFAATGHIGFALWAQGQENIAPQRAGAWSSTPLVTSASDPRPPVIVAEHEDVRLASLPDGSGEHRARVEWGSLAGATGYFVYETTESKLRIAAGLGEWQPNQTLSERLLALRTAFHANPVREPFTRLNSTAFTGTSTEVVIPRGSKEIHLYLVLGSSAGNIESGWPTLADPNRRKRFAAFAAPLVVPPSPPRIEVSRIKTASGAFRAKVTMQTRPGAPVVRVDLHRTRVDTAALSLDTMGPPVARIAGPDPTWRITPTTGTGPQPQALGTIAGEDDPGGSWRRVYYRAVAVAADNPEKGHYGGRSGPSNAVWVVLPPAAAPELSAVAADWPVGAPEAARFTFVSAAPAGDTDLGPHRIRVEVLKVGADGMLESLFAYPSRGVADGPDGRLSTVPTTPRAAPAFWREALPGGGSRYSVLVDRTDLADTLRLHVLLTDPLGRAGEVLLDSVGGAPLPAPDFGALQVKTIAGGRFVLSFRTNAPFSTTPLGPYRLEVTAAAPPGPLQPSRRGVTVRASLPSIAPLANGEDPFTRRDPIPLRQLHGTLFVFLRAKGDVDLTLTAPDGRSANASRRVP